MELDPRGITAAGSQTPACSGKRETFLKGFVAEKAGDQPLEKVDKKLCIRLLCKISVLFGYSTAVVEMKKERVL